jgi:hypothetical protein
MDSGASEGGELGAVVDEDATPVASPRGGGGGGQSGEEEEKEEEEEEEEDGGSEKSWEGDAEEVTCALAVQYADVC